MTSLVEYCKQMYQWVISMPTDVLLAENRCIEIAEGSIRVGNIFLRQLDLFVFE